MAICFVTSAATVFVGVCLVWALARQHWFQAALALLIIAGVHLVGYSLVGPEMRGYLYRGADDLEAFECPFKGLSYGSMLSEVVAKRGSSVPLFRTFEKEWWNFYRWLDYTTHPRWRWPYMKRHAVEHAEHRHAADAQGDARG